MDRSGQFLANVDLLGQFLAYIVSIRDNFRSSIWTILDHDGFTKYSFFRCPSICWTSTRCADCSPTLPYNNCNNRNLKKQPRQKVAPPAEVVPQRHPQLHRPPARHPHFCSISIRHIPGRKRNSPIRKRPRSCPSCARCSRHRISKDSPAISAPPSNNFAMGARCAWRVCAFAAPGSGRLTGNVRSGTRRNFEFQTIFRHENLNFHRLPRSNWANNASWTSNATTTATASMVCAGAATTMTRR